MRKAYSEEISVNENHCILCCKRFFVSKFQNKSLRSRTAALSMNDIRKINMYSAIRGQWDNRFQYLLCCIGFSIGFGNIWRFPMKVYYNGGGAFLIPYTILTLILGIPLLFLEMSLGQFSGRSPLKAFKLVPVFYGIGWCMFLIIIPLLIMYGTLMSWCYHYLFGSLNPTMAWTTCNHYFNSKSCLSPNIDIESLNKTFRYVSSTSEYWDYYVTGFIKYPSRTRFTMSEDPGRPIWHITLCLLLVWVVSAFILMFGTKVSGKVIYFSAIFPYIAIILLIVLGSTLPGAYDGILNYLTPNWSRMKDLIVYRDVLEQIFYSIGIGIGPMITFSSYNGVRDNVYRDAILVVAFDYLSSLLGGFAVFEILGYMSLRYNAPIEKIITSGPGLFFITYTEALATLPFSNLWTFIFMLMSITLGIGTQFAMVETLVTGMIDVCPVIRNTRSTKAVFVWLVCFIFFLLGMLICTPGGQFYFVVIDLRVISYGLPIIVMFEGITVSLIYGIKQFRYDCRMIMGFSLSWYWFIIMAIVSPILIIVILIGSLTEYKRTDVSGESLPGWGEVVAVIILLVVLSPILICAVHTVLLYKTKYGDLNDKEFIVKLFSAPVYWGPMYLKAWLLGSYYREKFLENMHNPEMYKYAPDYQHLNAIALSAKDGIE